MPVQEEHHPDKGITFSLQCAQHAFDRSQFAQGPCVQTNVWTSCCCSPKALAPFECTDRYIVLCNSSSSVKALISMCTRKPNLARAERQGRDLQDVFGPVGAAVCHGSKALHCNGAVAAVAGALQAGAGGALKAGHCSTTLVPASSAGVKGSFTAIMLLLLWGIADAVPLQSLSTPCTGGAHCCMMLLMHLVCSAPADPNTPPRPSAFCRLLHGRARSCWCATLTHHLLSQSNILRLK